MSFKKRKPPKLSEEATIKFREELKKKSEQLCYGKEIESIKLIKNKE